MKIEREREGERERENATKGSSQNRRRRRNNEGAQTTKITECPQRVFASFFLSFFLLVLIVSKVQCARTEHQPPRGGRARDKPSRSAQHRLCPACQSQKRTRRKRRERRKRRKRRKKKEKKERRRRSRETAATYVVNVVEHVGHRGGHGGGAAHHAVPRHGHLEPRHLAARHVPPPPRTDDEVSGEDQKEDQKD